MLLNKKIAILGLGVTGLSCIRFLQNKNIAHIILDTRKKEQLAKVLQKSNLEKSQNLYFADEIYDILKTVDLLILSPSIELCKKTKQIIKANKIKTCTDLDLFFFYKHKNAKTIGITGSNGKSTVAKLIFELLKSNNYKTSLGGNFGTAALDLLENNSDVYVLELSSFQLKKSKPLELDVATILNITDDHLDWHKTFFDYKNSKHKIYSKAKHKVFNHDDEFTIPTDKKRSLAFAKQKSSANIKCFYPKKTNNLLEIYQNDQKIIAFDNIKIYGVHNYLNIANALAVLSFFKYEIKSTKRAVENFQGLSHRFEIVAQYKNITFINDSKATNVGSVISALKNFSNELETLVLIVGGDSKNSSLEPLLPYLKKVYKIIALGKDAKRFLELNKENVSLVNSLKEAIDMAFKIKKMKNLLLSPACSSLDMYENFMARGDDFKQIVAKKIENEKARTTT